MRKPDGKILKQIRAAISDSQRRLEHFLLFLGRTLNSPRLNLILRLRKLSPKQRSALISNIIFVVALSIPLVLILADANNSLRALINFDYAKLFRRIWVIIPFGLGGLISWGLWVIRWSMSRRYKPLINDFRATTSVVVPSYREDPDVLVRCLETWLQNNPNEIILVVDVADADVLERLRNYADDERVRVIPFQHHGKRSALGVGIRLARHEIIVLTDSDTAWEPSLLDAVQMPFIDPKVGGVSTRQNAFQRESSSWRVVADWLINVRYLDYVPVEGMFGSVACLSGRTAAYRRAAILPVVKDLEYEYFLGQLCVAGDDGRLTWLILAQGYKTVYQGNARAWSMFPNTWRAFVKQRVRWSRNSYRCYLTAFYRGWLLRQPLFTQIRVMQILLTPVTMAFPMFYLFWSALHHDWGLLIILSCWALIGRGIRSMSHLYENPGDIVLLPLITLVVIYIALPVKLWAFVSMNKHGWLTRVTTSVGGEGQSEASLYVYPGVSISTQPSTPATPPDSKPEAPTSNDESTKTQFSKGSDS